LPDEGLGGERSTGAGKFQSICIQEDNLPMPDSYSYFMNLSLVSPKDQQEMNQANFYRLIRRGGRRTAKDGQLKLTNMIQEGAVFEQELEGRLIDISPQANNSYLRNGKAFSIPLHKNFETLWNTNNIN